MTIGSGLVTASGLTALLEEPDNTIKVAALKRIYEVVDEFWPEVADSVSLIESLFEDSQFPNRELAALVASKVFFHLEEYSEATRLALAAGREFPLGEKTDYTTVIVTRLVDEYIASRSSGSPTQNSRLTEFVEGLFAHSLKSGQLKSGLGIAIESHRLDWTAKFIQAASGSTLLDLLSYCQHHVRVFVSVKSLRSEILELVLQGYHCVQGKDRDWAGAAQCLYLLDSPDRTAELINEVFFDAQDADWGKLMALQLSFDIAAHEDQAFATAVVMKLEESSIYDATDLKRLRDVLLGATQVGFNLDFLFRNNKTDLLLLESLKSGVDQRSSVLHNGVVVAHSLMQAGTTNDAFLRKNLDWLAKSSHWAKFTATASLGVVHKGHVKDGRNLLSSYLPANGQAGRSSYSEGGAFMALGLIHANHHDQATEDYLITCLNAAQGNEVLQVGACLGLGLTCLATKSQRVYEALKNVLFLDSAVAGEAAGFAIGLVMAGSGDSAVVNDLLSYAHETQHEKIVRACAVGAALIVFEQEQNADTIIAQMSNDSDAIIRYGGMFAIGMAYCGTCQNSAVKQLLHVSVSDVSDDVRRASVIALGLVLAGEPTRLPKMLKLLSQSYNPHVRYGTCIALGIGCPAMAATVPEAVALLEPLLNDVSEFVRQGALLGMSLVCQETSDKQAGGKAHEFREKIFKMAGDKHQDIMCRFGAAVAHGLIDVGGRNASVNLFTRNGTLRLGAAVGFCLFSQMWYWYPMMLMVSLAVNPTALIAVNGDLKMPKQFAVNSKTKPSTFAYPAEFKVEAKESKSRLASAVLSAAKGRGVDEPAAAKKEDVVMDAAEGGKESEPQVPEPTEEILFNPCRVVHGQESVLHYFAAGEPCPVRGDVATSVPCRYVPVVPTRTSGYVVVHNVRPTEEETFLDFETPTMPAQQSSPVEGSTTSQPAASTGTAEEEAPPPEAFEWEG